MVFESSQSEKMQRPKKIGFALATMEYNGHLEGFLAMPKGQTTSFAPTINYNRGLREELETLTSSSPANNYCHGLRNRLKILISSAPINNHCCNFKEGLKIQTSSTPINNYCRGLREGLET